MKKILIKYIAVVCLLIIFVLYASSCYWPYIDLTGRWESEYPHMYIDFGEECTGVLWNADGTVTEIKTGWIPGFGISNAETKKTIFRGYYKCHNNTLILDLNDGGRIVMKRVGPATVDGKEYP